MLRYTQGNLLDSSAEALVNTVNEVGVMGKGVALMFKEAFPENAKAYEDACKRGEVRVGHMFVYENLNLFGPKWIINFPTKKNWRFPSKLEWIREGLKDLDGVLKEKGIRSVALPPLGCGNGGLQWDQVRSEIENALAELKGVEVLIYEPTAAYHNAPKREGLEELTPARAMIVELVRRYLVLGIDCTNLEIQKLGWFLQRVIRAMNLEDPLNLKFSANKYGPYADNLRHLLNGLDGSFLHCEKRLSDAGPFESIWFEESKREIVTAYFQSDAAKAYQPILEKTAEVVDGFESPLGMELLSTVDWLITEEKCAPTTEAVRKGLSRWPGGSESARRKTALFDERLVDMALTRLKVSALS